ncbi:MAG: hypothetical protein ACLRV7_05430 [Hoylesella buccalis]
MEPPVKSGRFRFGPWECFEQLNLETHRWVHWFNSERISEHNDFKSPIEVERLWYSEGVDVRRHRKSKV